MARLGSSEVRVRTEQPETAGSVLLLLTLFGANFG